MSLPDFEEVKDLLARSKRDDQSWGNLLRELSNGSLQNGSINSPAAGILTSKPSLLKVLGEWDFYSSHFLDQVASDYDVKSWQVTEYVEGLREALSIAESDLIVYEKEDSTVARKAGRELEPERPVPNKAQPERIYIQEPNADTDSKRLDYEVPAVSSAHTASTGGTSKTVLALTGLVFALAVILVGLIATITNQKPGSLSAPSSSGDSSDQARTEGGLENTQQPPQIPMSTEVYFTGIDLPVTNRLCNKKKSFCIYNLATLVNNESGEATYSFSDIANGQQVSINGTITISNIDRNGSNRTFTFAFRDDHNNTTPGWAAAGYFNLDQDSNPAKPGILTRFKTTESFGPKTPVGLENTSYLFPS